MPRESDNLKHGDVTEKIIKAFYSVYNTLWDMGSWKRSMCMR